MRRIAVWVGALGLAALVHAAAAQTPEPSLVFERRAEVHGARLFASVASDPLRRRALLFGGFTTGGIRNDTLEWDGVGWTRRTPSMVPSPRYSAGMVYETKHRRMILFGGIEAHRSGTGFVLSDNRTWEWSGGDWRVLSTQDPPPQRGTPAMTVDPRSGDIYLFGGGTGTLELDDFYRFDGQRWFAIAKPSGAVWPHARAAATLGYDAVGQRLILFGGMRSFAINASGNPTAGEPLVDTWAWNGTEWTELHPAAHPEARPPIVFGAESLPLTGRSSLVTDETRDALLLVQEAIEGVQIWRWDAPSTNWVQEFQPTDPTTPNLRFYASAFWDSARHEVHVIGGLATGAPSGSTPASLLSNPDGLGSLVDGSTANDEWGFNGVSWRRWQAPGEPSARKDAAAAFHQQLGVGVLFGGGFGRDTVLGDSFLWDGGRWYEGVKVDGSDATRPPARSGHAMAYDPDRSAGGPGAIVLFGGADATKSLADTWIWRDGWSKLDTPATGQPSARSRHVLAQVAGGVLLYGGVDRVSQANYPETWFLPSNGAAWQNLGTRIPERNSMCASSHAAQAYVFGGDLRGGGELETVFQRFGPGQAWSVLATPIDGPERRSDCALVADPLRGQLYLSGGLGPGEAKPNWFRYDIAAAAWSPLVPRPYDGLGDGPGRLVNATSFYDPIAGSVTLHGGERRDLDIIVGSTWRIREVGDACDAGQACPAGLSCVDGACCEASACGPCESCAMPDRRGVCTARGVVESAPGCDNGLACNVEGRCRASEGSACSDDEQCASGACAAGTCCPAEGCAERCIDEKTQKNKDGSSTDCGAYACKGVACLEACNSVNDCSVGSVCSAAQRCVPADGADSDQDGCSCNTPGGRSTLPAFGLALAVLLGVRGLRRRRGQ